MSSEDTEQVLLPTVLWAQRKHLILLRVQIQPLEVCLREKLYGPLASHVGSGMAKLIIWSQ